MSYAIFFFHVDSCNKSHIIQYHMSIGLIGVCFYVYCQFLSLPVPSGCLENTCIYFFLIPFSFHLNVPLHWTFCSVCFVSHRSCLRSWSNSFAYWCQTVAKLNFIAVLITQNPRNIVISQNCHTWIVELARENRKKWKLNVGTELQDRRTFFRFGFLCVLCVCAVRSVCLFIRVANKSKLYRTHSHTNDNWLGFWPP